MSVHSHLTGSTYRRRHTMQTKAKKWPPSQTRVADRVRGPMWRGTWLIGQAHETEGSYPRPRGATVGRSRRLLPHGLARPRLSSGPWRGQRALSGSAAPPVRTSSNRPLAGPRVQDQDDDDPHDPPATTTELDFSINDERPANMNQGERASLASVRLL